MAEHVMKELEGSAQILLAPPNVVTSDQRHQAEQVFINFLKTKSPFDLCKYILETTSCDYVQFQAASLMKQGIIREWSLLVRDEIIALRNYILQYVIQKTNLQSYVREQLVLVEAIMIKRSSVDGEEKVLDNILTQISQLISSGNTSMQMVGCSVLNAMLIEFSSSTRASDVGLTWETHLRAKKSFETTHLKKIFQFCLQGLNEALNLGPPFAPEVSSLLERLVALAEQVLSWNFQFSILLPRKLVGLFESQQSPTLRPSIEWKDTLMQPNVPQLFFKLYFKVADNASLCHHVLQCLNQLASLNGVLVNCKEDRSHYLTWFLEGLLEVISRTPVKQYAALGIASTVGRLANFYPPPVMTLLPPNVLSLYLTHLTTLTCHFIETAAQEDVMNSEETVYQESLEYVLDAWVPILQDFQVFPENILAEASSCIFSCYLRCHLSYPDGTRSVKVETEDEIEEAEEDDRAKYKEQLSVIGLLGRHVLETSVPLLTKFLEEKTAQLHSQLQRVQQAALTPSDGAAINSLNEDIHWLIMITGHVLTTVSEGETPLIPAKVTGYCYKNASKVNVETTLKVLSLPSHPVSSTPGAEEVTDPIIRLTTAVFRISEVEKLALEANLTHVLSPEVANTIVWFLRRWSVTYLLPNESYYSEMSTVLITAFGRDSEAGQWVLDFIISKLRSNLMLWMGETSLVCETSLALVSVLNNLERGRRAVSCPSLLQLLREFSTGQFQLLPSSAKRAIIRALVIAGTALKTDDNKDQYWEQLLNPVQERFRSLVCSDSFRINYCSENVRMEILDLIESFSGVVGGVTTHNLTYLLPFILPFLNELANVVSLYHNYNTIVTACLQVYRTVVCRVLCFLNQNDSRKVYECCLNMMKEYAKHNSGKITIEASAEENQYQDILILMELLTDLLSKDFLDFSPSGLLVGVSGQPFVAFVSPDNQQNQGEQESAVSTTLYGLNIIMPMMSAELLKFPSLCSQYFKLITFVAEIYPDKICQLPDDLFQNLMASVQLGLVEYTPDIASLCLDFISVLCLYIHKSELFGSRTHQALQPYLKMLLEMVVLQPLDSELTQTAGSTLFTLMCVFQEHYKELVNAMVSSQADPVTRQRLAESFTMLTANIQFVPDRPNRTRFRDTFESFITSVKGFLCVK